MIPVTKLVISACIVVLATSSAFAKNEGKLPKNATPLTSEEVKGFYAGKTIQWDKGSEYRYPDGKILGIAKTGKWYGEGTWKTSGNEVCFDVVWYSQKKSDKPYNDHMCEKLYHSGKAVWIENTAGDAEYAGDIWTGVEKKLSKSDKVSKKAEAFKAKYGY